MPRLKRNAPDLLKNGPLLLVRIEPVLAVQEAMRADGDEIPTASILALIDTGANGTLIQTAVVAGLGFESLGTVFLLTPSTLEPLARQEYRVRLVLSEDIAFEVDVVEAPLAGQSIQGLIGRDILQLLKFTYDGPQSQFTIDAGAGTGGGKAA